MKHPFLLAALLTAPAFAEPPAPCPAIARIQLTVDGKKAEWAPSSLRVEKGDLLVVEATGKVNVGTWYGEVGPEGVHNAHHAGRLDLKIGAAEVIAAGEHAFFVVKEGGELTLRVNDWKYEDNSGSYSVVVTRVPASALPAPRAPEPH
jgi:hypothetical protein